MDRLGALPGSLLATHEAAIDLFGQRIDLQCLLIEITGPLTVGVRLVEVAQELDQAEPDVAHALPDGEHARVVGFLCHQMSSV